MNEENNMIFPWQGVYDELEISELPFNDRPLGAYVEEHAKLRSKNAALQYFDKTFSYGELNELANRFANVLVNLGVTKNDVVGIHLPNIPQYVIALIAVSKIGCAGSGVSPLLSPPELAHQIDDAGISVMLSLDALTPGFEKIKDMPPRLKTIIVTGSTDHLNAQTSNLPELSKCHCVKYADLMATPSISFQQREVHWNDTFMIQYTGGTTGKPKGAELSVRNLLFNTVQYNCYAPYQVGTEIACSAFPMFHVAGLSFILGAMQFGAHALLIPDPRDVEFFSSQMMKFPPTRLGAVPTLYSMLLDCPTFRKIDFSKLKTAATGAAPMSRSGVESLETVIGKNKLSDYFGMTETSPTHTCHPHTRYKLGSVGIPVPGAETRIVDIETGTMEMPFGEVGEIISSGPQIMKGYLNQPEESAKAIRNWRGKRWMYTGDVGYMDDEGYIYVCDRAKDMLVVGGYKVFSIEVEDKLKELNFVGVSAVIGTADEKRPGNDVVNLYIELAEEHRGRDHGEIKEAVMQFFSENLAPYKKPKMIHIVDQIPLTSVGKIDKKVLRKRV